MSAWNNTTMGIKLIRTGGDLMGKEKDTEHKRNHRTTTNKAAKKAQPPRVEPPLVPERTQAQKHERDRQRTSDAIRKRRDDKGL